MIRWTLGLLILTLPVMARQEDLLLDQMRIEISDLKAELKNAQVELQILTERLQKQESRASQTPATKNEQVTLTLSSLERKVLMQEKELAALNDKLHTLDKSEEFTKLKATLSSISKALSQKEAAPTSTCYKVKAGDTLDRIARREQTTVEEIKRVNQLKHDKIIVDQELVLP